MKGQMLKLFVVVTVCLSIAVGACMAPPPPPAPTPVPPTPTPDPAAPVQAWVDALNSGDVDAALAFFTDNVLYDFVFIAGGKESLRMVFDWLVGIESQYRIQDCQQPQSDRVACTFTVVDGCIAAYGATGGLPLKGVFIFREDGKIKNVTGTRKAPSGTAIGGGSMQGSPGNGPTAPKNTPKPTIPSGGMARVQVKLCQEYMESLKATPMANPLDIVQQYQDAVGRHDVDTAMALFTDDATYGWGDYFTTSEKTMIRNWLEYAAGLNSQTKVNDCKPAGPTVTCEWRFVHDCFGAEGAIGAGYDMGGSIVFTVKDGKISDYVFSEKLDPEYSQWGEAFFKWLEDSHPMEIGSMSAGTSNVEIRPGVRRTPRQVL